LKRGKRDTDPDEIAVDYQDAPEVRGKLWTYPEIVNGWEIVIDIAGDPDGLRSLEEILVYLADYDQSARGVPGGESAHLHFFPGRQLGNRSAQLEVTLADASITGKLTWGD
jgi:hypothetical protein